MCSRSSTDVLGSRVSEFRSLRKPRSDWEGGCSIIGNRKRYGRSTCAQANSLQKVSRLPLPLHTVSNTCTSTCTIASIMLRPVVLSPLAESTRAGFGQVGHASAYRKRLAATVRFACARPKLDADLSTRRAIMRFVGPTLATPQLLETPEARWVWEPWLRIPKFKGFSDILYVAKAASKGAQNFLLANPESWACKAEQGSKFLGVQFSLTWAHKT